jgi:RimJ/RimL family protein N-acetyltransferase
MFFSLEPAAPFAQQLNHLLIKATFDVSNEWFFFDGAHSGANSLEQNLSNTWLHENLVAVNANKEIFGYFEGQWQRPIDIISGFRTINFNPKLSGMFIRALFAYLDYLFVNRGCQVFNWTVAHQNEHALKQYEKFIRYHCGHKVGIRHYAQKSYTGKVSDINLYEITRAEYFDWKVRGFRKRQNCM